MDFLPVYRALLLPDLCNRIAGNYLSYVDDNNNNNNNNNNNDDND